MDNGVPPQRRSPESDRLAERMEAASDREKASVLVDHFAEATMGPPSAWVDGFVSRVEEFGLPVRQIRTAATDLAWLARKNGQGYLDDADRARVLAAGNTLTARLCLAYIHGQRLRFDFKFAQLHRLCVDWLAEFEDDALVLSFAAFAALGTRATNGPSLFRRAVDAPDADHRTNQVLLTGINFADHLPEQPQMMLDLSDEMMARGQENAIVYYRRATAYRKLACYGDGLYEIDRAIDALAPGDVMVHEQFTQERRSIILAQDLQNQIERNTQAVADSIAAQVDERLAAASAELEQRLDEASLRLAQRIDAAQEMVSSGLLKMVEILGLFVALVGFIAGSGAVVIKSHSLQERALSMLLVVGGALIFFALLRLVTTVGRRRVRAER